MANQDIDQSEDATPHKLDEARKKGSVAKSMDLVSVAMLAAGCVVLYANGWDAWRDTLLLQQRIFSHGGSAVWQSGQVGYWMGENLIGMVSILAPLFLTVIVVAVLVNILQTGPVFTFHPLSPEFERLNPAAGFKRLFSLRTLYEVIKSLLKMCLLCGVLYVGVRDLVPGLVGLTLADPKAYPELLIGLAGGLLVKLVLALLVVAMIDLIFSRWEFGKRMRMSKREVKDEVKNREGDPRIRSRIRELRKEMLKRSRSLSRVPAADVLVTNPTRIAVALSYKHGESGAPQVIAKGAGELARSMRMLASRHNIPIVQNRMLARTLFREVDYDGYVPEKLYPQVAKIMVWVYAMRKMKR